MATTSHVAGSVLWTSSDCMIGCIVALHVRVYDVNIKPSWSPIFSGYIPFCAEDSIRFTFHPLDGALSHFRRESNLIRRDFVNLVCLTYIVRSLPVSRMGFIFIFSVK